MQQNQIIDKLEQLQDRVRREYKAEVKAVFGSCVRGDAGLNSDLDLLVEFDQGADLFDLVALTDYLTEQLGTEVDVVPINSLREEIRDNVLQEAVYL